MSAPEGPRERPGDRSASGWSVFRAADHVPLEEFLVRKEYRCVALSEHFARRRRSGKADVPREAGRAWVHFGADSEIDGAAFLRAGEGLCRLPASDVSAAEFLSLARDSGALSSLSGPGDDLDRLSAQAGFYSAGRAAPSIGGLAADCVADARRYLLLRLPEGALPQKPETPGALSKRLARVNDLEVRLASIRDIPALCRLHGAYEKEELDRYGWPVLASIPERITLIMRQQIAVVATRGGKAIGKANTNARGFRTDQLGGVYVSPEERGRGVGAAMVGALAGFLAAGGREVCLFVRPENAPAIALYGRLGFEAAGEYASISFRAFPAAAAAAERMR